MLLSNRDKRFINLAKAIAQGAPLFADARIGAVLAYKNEVISTGFNTSKKSPKALEFARHEEAIYPHAEVMAIFNASKILQIEDFRRAVLYVARVKQNHRHEVLPGIARPCEGCERCIRSFGIRRVVWTTDSELIDGWKVNE